MDEAKTGEQLIIEAGVTAITIAQCMDNRELHEFCELLGLLKHNLEIIKIRRIIAEKKGN